MEKKHEMMSLEDSEQLKGRMKFFEQELLKHHHIDPNLYVEYDVKRGLRDSAVLQRGRGRKCRRFLR